MNMKFIELNLINKNLKLEEFKIIIFGLSKFKKLNRLIIHLTKNECDDNCIDFFLSDFKRIKKLQKLELDLSNSVSA